MVTSADIVIDAGQQQRNPPWTRDELILALDLYMVDPQHPPGKTSQQVTDLSNTLAALATALGNDRRSDFRNRNGVYMKMMNFRRFDPAFQSAGKKGLTRGNHLEEEIWSEFAHDRDRLGRVATAIRDALISVDVAGLGDIDENIAEAIEGRVLTRLHLVRERNRNLVKQTKERALRKTGKLVCQGCGFDFEARYGERGRGFIECHHTRAVETLADVGQRVTEDDLALVCANCHRMIHTARPWLSLSALQELLKVQAAAVRRPTKAVG